MKKVLSAILVLIMLLSMIPFCAWADGICTCGTPLEDGIETPPSCEEPGYAAGSYCPNPDCTENRRVITEQALGHDMSVDWSAELPYKAPTCTDVGLEAGLKCSRCNHTEQKEIPALGHDMSVDWSAELPYKAPTCTETGLEAGLKCSRCDHTEQKEIPADGVSHKWNNSSTDLVKECLNGCGAKQYRVTFWAFDQEFDYKYVDAGKPVSKPEISPEKLGYYFRYWYLDDKETEYKETEYDFTKPVTEAITLRANNLHIKYKINLRTYYVNKNGNNSKDTDGTRGNIESIDFAPHQWHGAYDYNQVSFYIEDYGAGYAFYFVPKDGYTVKSATLTYDNGKTETLGKDFCIITLDNYHFPLLATATIKVVFQKIDTKRVGAALTGDDFDTWMAIAGISLIGAAGTGIMYKKKRRKEE